MQKNQLGYPVLTDEAHRKIFGGEKRPVMSRLGKQKAEGLLKQFGVSTPVEHPNGLYDGPLPLVDLKGPDLKAHFEAIATEQVGQYKEWASSFAACELAPLPPIEVFLFEPGWKRYSLVEGEWVVETVPYPLEDAFTFDTETFVKGGNFPIIGTALSDKAAYIWLASELVDPTIPQDLWDQYSLIPVGQDKFIAGHNISFDRVRAQEGYSLDRTKPENFYFDTLSAHIGVSGLAGGQRWLYVLSGKDPDDLTEDEKRKLRYAPKWLDQGATNSLVQCYNFHVYEVRKFFGDEDIQPLGSGDKKARNIFVDAENLSQIKQVLTESLDYALKDAFYTAELFQALWPKYLDSTPSMVALAGHYHLNGSVIPLTPDWPEWIERTEEVFKQYNDEMTELCRELVNELYDAWKVAEDREIFEVKDPWLSQLDWEIKTAKGKYGDVPNWYRPFIKDPDQKIGVKSNLAHLMLKLKWEGSPMVMTKDKGWCFYNSSEELEQIPHPKGKGENVGGVLSKEFVEDMQVGRLSSDLPQATRALEIANAVSYWTSVRKRVMDRIFLKVSNPHGEDAYVTLPDILAHGTVTRRTVEPLMLTMCSTKNWRIGTELKTRVTAPDGWKIVGADFDGQELQIASIYSDKWEGGHVGCSPFGFNVLSGSKENGTDSHSALAKVAGVDRDTAKALGFAILYGAGLRTLQNYIRRKYPEKSPTELRGFATRALEGKKGVKRNGLYDGGSDSGCFNLMEEISMKMRVPQLPCLGTKISTAMRPAAVGDDFHTARINWTIQASGAEILSVMLVATQWLIDEYKIPARFTISIHDEIWYMTPERYAEQFAVLFQIAHMYSWSLFQSNCGIPDLPLSRAFFSSVAIDERIRKSPRECTVSPSNPEGKREPDGVEHSMRELSEMGAIDKLTTRYNAIKKGLIK
jgi:DNA polymerase gamma 1